MKIVRGSAFVHDELLKLQRGAVIEVWWLDSCGRSRWESADEIMRWAEHNGRVEHRTAGYFFAVTSHTVVIVQSMVHYDAESDDMVDSAQTIPLVALTGLRVLRAAG